MARREFDPEAFTGLRKRLGFSQGRMATKLGVTPDSIRNYEHGRSQPCGEVVDRIWRTYIIPLDLDIELYK